MEPRAYRSGADGCPPPFLDTSVSGYPRAETPTEAATIAGPYWFFMNGEEIRNATIRGKVRPNRYDSGQLLIAIRNIAGRN